MFAHLHVHSTASDGSASPAELAQAAAQLGYTTLALTDHNTTSGHAAFLDACRHYGIQPIVGAEVWVIGPDLTRGHLLVLPYTPQQRAKLAVIAGRSNLRLGQLADCGVVTSACLGGLVGRALKAGDYWAARDAAIACREALGHQFYLEVQPTFGAVMGWVFSLGRELGIPVIATNDVHHLDEGPLDLATPEQMRARSPFTQYQLALEAAGALAQALVDHAQTYPTEGGSALGRSA
jgi:DNA polymerase III alpha subunit